MISWNILVITSYSIHYTKLYDEIGIRPGQISEDGKFSLEEVECLGHCGTAPVVQVNGEFYEDMNVDKLKSLLATRNNFV